MSSVATLSIIKVFRKGLQQQQNVEACALANCGRFAPKSIRPQPKSLSFLLQPEDFSTSKCYCLRSYSTILDLIWIRMNNSFFFTTVDWGRNDFCWERNDWGWNNFCWGETTEGLGTKRRGAIGNRTGFLYVHISESLTAFSGRQFEDGGSGEMGAPSLNIQHSSLGTSGRCWLIISAVSTALFIVELISLVYFKFRSFNLWPVISACILQTHSVTFL